MLDAYWVDDWYGNLYEYDATTLTRTTVASTGTAYDGIAYIIAVTGTQLGVPERAGGGSFTPP